MTPLAYIVADRLLFAAVAALAAEMERDLNRERTLDGLHAAAAVGRRDGLDDHRRSARHRPRPPGPRRVRHRHRRPPRRRPLHLYRAFQPDEAAAAVTERANS